MSELVLGIVIGVAAVFVVPFLIRFVALFFHMWAMTNFSIPLFFVILWHLTISAFKKVFGCESH